MTTDTSLNLPAGVGLTLLTTHPDNRGELTEIFRNEWHGSSLPVQWMISRNAPNVLRGVHVHAFHWDYSCVIAGEMFVGLHDLRPERPADRRSIMLHLTGGRLQMLAIPPGVAHGFYSPAESMHLTGTSRYYDPVDHRGCRWDSPELGLDWPCREPDLSARDRAADSYAESRAAFLARVKTAPART